MAKLVVIFDFQTETETVPMKLQQPQNLSTEQFIRLEVSLRQPINHNQMAMQEGIRGRVLFFVDNPIYILIRHVFLYQMSNKLFKKVQVPLIC